MPFAIDEVKMNAPDMQVMDPAKPPTKQIPYQPFPKMVYLHPKDKAKEHRALVVQNQAELDNAMKQGFRIEPHVPDAGPADLTAGFEADISATEPERRGPGRPPKTQEAA